MTLNQSPVLNEELSKHFQNDGVDRFFHGYHYPQNPYQPADYSNYYPAQPGYGLINNGYGLKLGATGPNMYGEHAPAGFSGGGGGGYGHATFDASNGHPRHKSKGGSSAALNALTLLAFLFFINILQNCLKEQMHSSNPTVMVMTAGTGRFRKTEAGNLDASKEVNDYDLPMVSTESVTENVDVLTNDRGDVFYQPQPQHTISSKLANSFEARNLNETELFTKF